MVCLRLNIASSSDSRVKALCILLQLLVNDTNIFSETCRTKGKVDYPPHNVGHGLLTPFLIRIQVKNK